MSTQRNTPLILTIALLSLAATASFSRAETVRWRSNIDAAKIEATQSGKLVLLHFWTPSCGPCRALDQDVFSQPQIGDFLEQHFVPVKVNADLSPALSGVYQIQRVPSDIVLSAQGNVVAKLSCPLQADAYAAQLGNVASHYTQFMANPSAAARPTTQAAYGGLQVGQYNAQPVATSAPHAVPTDATVVTPAAAYSTANPYVSGPPASAQAAVQDVAQPSASPAAPQNYINPYIPAAAPATPPVAAATAPPATPATPVARQSIAPQPTAPQLPPGSPALAFDGYCPVTLKSARKWVVGNTQFGAVHRGRTFLFTGEAERQQFLASPDSYSPVFSGMDPVLMLDQNKMVEGSRKYGYEYRGAFYLFHSPATMAHFANDPVRYATQVRQAMNRSDASASGAVLR